jgi:hypothetical protein
VQATLDELTTDLARQASELQAKARATGAIDDLDIQKLRRGYLRTEATVDYFADAVNTRTTGELGAQLRACDLLAEAAMSRALDPMQRPVPPVLTLIDAGRGASILKAYSPLAGGRVLGKVAVIKVVRHNLHRPTAIIHEAGHQVNASSSLGWNAELARALASTTGSQLHREVWSLTASEIAADAFAFVNCGYGSVAALHDVVAGSSPFVFRMIPGDPHPVSFLRVLLNLRFCNQAYGPGPWDGLREHWLSRHPIDTAPAYLRSFLHESVDRLSEIATRILWEPYKSFDGRALIQLIQPPEPGVATAAAIGSRGSDPVKVLAGISYAAATTPHHTQDPAAWLTELGARSLARVA